MPTAEQLRDLSDDLTALRDRVLAAEDDYAEELSRVRDRHRASARNLVHYVAARGTDLRDLQTRLSAAGLSSLGRMEAGVLGHLDAVIDAVHALDGTADGDRADDAQPSATDREEAPGAEDALTPARGREILERNTVSVLGPGREDRQTRIMVTMPSEAAEDPEIVRGMIEAGMDVARVNCAHDDEAAWAAMIETIRAGGQGDRPAPLVAMDLAGPKLRTGPIAPGPGVVKVKPRREDTGVVLEPSRVRLVLASDDAAEDERGEAVRARVDAGVDAVLPLAADAAPAASGSGRSGDAPAQVLASLEPGDEVRLTDGRGSRRVLQVAAVDDRVLELTATKTVYWRSGLELASDAGVLTVGELPPLERAMRVHDGDEVVLTRAMDPAPAADAPPYRIGCSLEQAFEDVAVGDRVLIDDGKITGEVTRVDADEIALTVTSAGPKGAKLKAEKGINFPDTDLDIPALTDEDRSHLPFVAAHADAVNMSFVRTADDVAQLIEALEEAGGAEVDITLKIETVEAFEQLPLMLLEAMRWNDVGVMIARGDLAVEAGFERMAEVQEEILWLCEAAHVPTIWATQILESLAKDGLPSRAEITDAAMAQRAEGAMLNKGPYITDAITALGDILGRMGGHARKKRDMLRRLEAWSD